MNKSGAIGTWTAERVVEYLRTRGYVGAERSALHGNRDVGDITGVHNVCIEVKGGKSAERASKGQVTAWLRETETERLNRGVDMAFLVTKRAGVGQTRVGEWRAFFPGDVFVKFLGVNPFDTGKPDELGFVEMYLSDAISILQVLGY